MKNRIALLRAMFPEKSDATLAKKIANRRRMYRSNLLSETYFADVSARILWAAGVLSKPEVKSKDAEADRVVANEILDDTFEFIAEVFELLSKAALKAQSGTREIVLNRMVEHLVSGTDDIYRKFQKPDQWASVRKVALKRTDFPSIVSIFGTENKAFEKMILESLQLGVRSYRVDPKRTLSSEAHMAMEIVETIQSSFGKPDNIYETAYPKYKELRFCDANKSGWAKLIEFHMDFHQAPEGWFRSKLERMDLAKEYNRATLMSWYENTERAHKEVEVCDFSKLGIDLSKRKNRWLKTYANGVHCFRRISDIREFRSLLRSGRDKSVTTEAKLFIKVKQRVVKTAWAMMPK